MNSGQYISDNKILEKQLVKLQDLAVSKNLDVLKTVDLVEDCQIIQSNEFQNILSFVENQNEVITVICYAEDIPSCVFYQRSSDLMKAEKIKLINENKHYCFREPVDRNIKIWRYVDLPKFLDFLKTKTLYFARADLLRTNDSMESAVFSEVQEETLQTLSYLPSEEKIQIPGWSIDLTANQLNQTYRLLREGQEKQAKKHFINCWHMNNSEIFAMWNIYSKEYGVCIQSTYKDLLECFIDQAWNVDNKNLYLGEVLYIDSEKDSINPNNLFGPVMYKRKEFEYENELRCLAKIDSEPLSSDSITQGIKIAVNLDKLIHNIYINPFTPSWFENIIKDVCEKYGISAHKVRYSKLKCR